jgi:dihydroneopterin aldolase
MLGSSKNLLETLAEAIAGNILDSFPIIGVTVKVKKPRPPIKGKFIGGASVEIYRNKL